MEIFLTDNEGSVTLTNWEDQRDLIKAIESNQKWIELCNEDMLINTEQITCIVNYRGKG